MAQLSRTAAIARALAAVEERVDPAVEKGRASTGGDRDVLRRVGRITVAFHPDRLDRRGLTAAEGLVVDGGYLPQWLTGASSGSRSALPGGLRATWEESQFAVDADVLPAHRPVYGAWDLLHHRHGGSPEFGSCYLVLHDEMRARCTLSLGDTHLAPDEVGTFRRPESILRGLADQAESGCLLGQALGVDDLRAVLAGHRLDAPRRTSGHYVEVQVHGGVRLEDVAAIVVDPSFSSSGVEDHLRQASVAARAAFQWHPGTVIAPRDLASDPREATLVDDDAYLMRLVKQLEDLAAPSLLAAAADIGRLVAETRPGPPGVSGDEARSPLQRVKHLWRLTYLLGGEPSPDD